MRSLALALSLATLLAGAAQAGTGRYYTEPRPYPMKALTKLGRGIANVSLAPSELYTQTYKETLRASIHGDSIADIGVGTFAGVFKGVGFTFARFGIGLFDFFTFLLPTRPLMRPATPAIFLEDLPSSVSGGATLPR